LGLSHSFDLEEMNLKNLEFDNLLIRKTPNLTGSSSGFNFDKEEIDADEARV
jgi:hypothetical protein